MTKSRVFIVCGLGFGDEGKGAVTDLLARTCGASLVVRYNGGPQAGHNVVAPDGAWHCFAQFGAGTLVPGVRTFLSPFMLVEPENLLAEAAALEAKGCADALERIFIDPRCAVITPLHKMICQMLEIGRGRNRFGSCGLGVGEAVKDRDQGQGLTIGDIFSGSGLGDKLRAMRLEKMRLARRLLLARPTREMGEAYEYFARRTEVGSLVRIYHDFTRTARTVLDPSGRCLDDALAGRRPVIFEGAQGALLDRRRGFSPFITKSEATFHNARTLLAGHLWGAALLGNGEAAKIGVMRAYGHRHGPGPFVTEDPGLLDRLNDPYNAENRWQGAFRVGWPDLVALRYGLLINGGVDAIALTGLDRLTGLSVIKVCTGYDYEGDTSKLDAYFEWERLDGGRARIHALRQPPDAGMPEGELAGLLFRCRPVGWVEMPGWTGDISGAKRPEDLPVQARRYVELLQSRLKTPIKIVSVSPRADGKMFLG